KQLIQEQYKHNVTKIERGGIIMIMMDGVVKRYNELIALDHFSFNAQNGEIVGLLGPNGCGKTTAINCMLSLLTFDSGDIEIFGRKVDSNNNDVKRRIGI